MILLNKDELKGALMLGKEYLLWIGKGTRLGYKDFSIVIDSEYSEYENEEGLTQAGGGGSFLLRSFRIERPSEKREFGEEKFDFIEEIGYWNINFDSWDVFLLEDEEEIKKYSKLALEGKIENSQKDI
jgi:hypothetical protein